MYCISGAGAQLREDDDQRCFVLVAQFFDYSCVNCLSFPMLQAGGNALMYKNTMASAMLLEDILLLLIIIITKTCWASVAACMVN